MELESPTPEAGRGLPRALDTCLTAIRQLSSFMIEALTGPTDGSFYRQAHGMIQLKAEQTAAVRAADQLIVQQAAETMTLQRQINDILIDQDF